MINGYPQDVVLGTGVLGGTGDHADFSTLAERFHHEGHRVHFHRDNIARNDEILELFYGLNPYIEKEPTNETPNIGYVNQGAFYDLANTLPIGAIEAMERVHGLPPPYSLAPKIYYKPKPYFIDLSQHVLLDMAALSSTITEEGWFLFHQKMVDRFGLNTIYSLTFPNSVNHNQPDLPAGAPSLHVDSIFTYVDMLASCRAWIGSEAGGQALAAAVRGEHDAYDLEARPEAVCLIAPGTFNSRSYTFRGIDYRVSKFAEGSDYLYPAEVPMYRYSQVCKTNVLKKRTEWRTAKGLE